MAGGFREADVTRNGGFQELLTEELAEVLGDLLGEVRSVVVHGEQDTFETEGRVEGLGNAVESTDQLGHTFEGEVLGLERHEETVGCDEGVQGEQV